MEAILQVQKLCKSFDGVPLLEDIDIAISAGEIFGVIGKSGAGKSTLVRCINYIERPTSGDVLFDGQSLSGMTRSQLYLTRQSMGMIFQQFNLLMQRNALDNICFPLEIAGIKRGDAKVKARRLLELVGLPEKAKSYPAQLSGGQRQRVAIARAIALNPKVLLCDEATSALDPETTLGVLALLRDINRRFGITIVVITHEMQVVEALCDRVAILDEHRVVEEDLVSGVFANPKTNAAKQLIYPDGDSRKRLFDRESERCYRIIFNGNSSYEPVIADLILHFKERINILFADTKDIGGEAHGQMVVQFPDNEAVAQRMRVYIQKRGLAVEEVRNFV